MDAPEVVNIGTSHVSTAYVAAELPFDTVVFFGLDMFLWIDLSPLREL